MRPILALVLLLALDGVAAPAAATNALASDIVGQVVDHDNRPIPGALVRIEHLETGRVIVRTTNARGRYHAVGLRSDGRYRVSITSGEGAVSFPPGSLLLGHAMRRNAVLLPPGAARPAFATAWIWRDPPGTHRR